MNDDSSSRKPRDSGADDSGSLMSLLKRLIPGSRRGGDDAVREALEELIEDDDAEAIDSHERLLLGNILRLRDTTAYDIMIPRADIFAIDVSTPLADVAEQVGRTGHSRVPVFRETLDDVVGMILIKDLLPVIARGQTMDLRHLMRKVMFVSPAIRVLDLLVEMRLKRTHMALVVDEYGGIDGLVTIEDLVEQIVGEIEDEHDDDSEPEMLLTGDGTLTADARVALEDFEDRFGTVFSDEDKEDTDTLGGLVFRLAGRVPLRGELISHASGLEFEVVDADPRHIRRLRVRNLPQTTAAVEGA
ncbi:hemolysin family protein [Novispirillum itersonii]|uniref:CBS domain containing-hemolysin-like protein n=1 Tax=Novispirillum itersonii TaxID=189 RepID=A0A7W9ZFS6_NOVIT|nr:hemolysin family protein [Novispirillum itersonii]MBB6209229.1 CBS domain containing-hemolysin-like protein [Novispirillum itersonii]